MAMKNPKQPTETIQEFSNHLKTLRTQKASRRGNWLFVQGSRGRRCLQLSRICIYRQQALALHLASALACRVEELFNLRTAEDIS